MKRALSVLLILAIAAAAFACADPGTADETSAETTVSETEAETASNEPELPAYDGEGADFTFLIRRSEYAYDDEYVYSEALDGELINDAIYNRNAAAQEKYNVNFVGVFEKSPAATAKKAVTAGDSIYDVMCDEKTELAGMISSGYLYNLRNFTYSDFTAEYWDANAYEQMSVSGKLYFMPSDISLANFEGARFLYFNRTLAENYNLGDLYQYVYDNKWTLDQVLTLISSISEDLNGDGVMNREDRFGLLAEKGENNGNILYFVTSAGIKETENDENGIPQMTFMNDKLIQVCDLCSTVLNDGDYCLYYEDAASGADTTGYPHLFQYCRSALFGTDHFLFVQNGFGVITDFKDMDSDYGILPNPKYDDGQENYYHRIDRFSPMFAVPVTASDFERIDIILDYLSWKSSELLLPSYYETYLKVKRTRDEDAPAMIDIIKGSISYEISDVFSAGIAECIWLGYSSGNMASTYAKNESSITRKLDKLAETYATGS